MFLIPGVIALTLKMRGELNWDSPDEAFPVLMSNLLPSGLRGLVAAGLLAALMSSLASVFNSCSTLFTVDIYKKLRPNTPEKQLVKTGQIATLVVVVIGIIWIPIMSNISGVLYEYLQSVQSYIAPPITAVFLMGIFNKRINAKGAYITLVFGLIAAAARIVLELIKNSLDPNGALYYLGAMNFLSFSAWFFLLCVLLLIGVSLLSDKPEEARLKNLTYSTITAEAKAESKATYNWKDIAVSIAILSIVISVMILFNGK